MLICYCALFTFDQWLMLFVGQDQLRNAEKFLSQAHWTVLQNSHASPSLHSQLHRNLGLLATAREEHLMAKKHFAEDVIYE